MIFRLIRSAARSFGLIIADLIPGQAVAVCRGRDFDRAGHAAGQAYADALDDPDDGGEAMEPAYHPFVEGFAPPIADSPGPSWRDLTGTGPTVVDTVTPLVVAGISQQVVDDIKKAVDYNATDMGELGRYVRVRYVDNIIDRYLQPPDRL